MSRYFLLLIILFCLQQDIFGQSGSERLKKEQAALEKQIATTKSLLEKSKKNTRLSLEEVQLIDQQVKYRERLLRNINNQIRSSELKIEQKQGRIAELKAEIEKLKKQYAELLLYAYKKRNKYGDLMFIFSARTVEEALKRKLYLEKLAEIQEKQLRLIKQNMELLKEEISTLEEEKKKQQVLAGQKKEEREEILKAKQEKEEIYERYRQQEQEILAELREQEKDKARLQQEIQAAIQREIAAEQAKIEKARREAEAKRKAEEAKRKANTPTVDPPEKKEDPVTFLATKEANLIGKDFASNKGRLPWPVDNGTVTENYGRNPHPTLPNVFTQNNGVDISTVKNANVRAVFDGEVTSVINIPGAGKVVIIKHGNYRSVYSNLQEVYVTKGTKVNTKMPIGSLLPNKSGNVSVAHFEIHEVKGNTVTQLNPNLWITQ
ncbi:MAG: peptidoglycan DD-metalloendopeptidase family protein [Brumimicrobium sp.]|nr:peptidoglycan DD-metalloendopeptidase family protein [Brumimicrobium sp.]